MVVVLLTFTLFQNPHFPALQANQAGARRGMSGLHRDILNGDDETLDPADFLPSMY